MAVPQLAAPETQDQSTGFFLKNVIAPAAPYLAIGVGLLLLHNVWIAVVSYHLLMLILILLSGDQVRLGRLFNSASRIIPIAAGAVGVCGGILLFLLWPWLAVDPGLNPYLHSIGLNSASWPFFIAYFMLVNPWLEEYYWRGFLGSGQKHPAPADFLFAGYHILVLAGKVEIVWLIAVFAVLAFAAWAWRQANRMGQGLLPSFVSHLAADITIILVIYWMTAH